MARLLGMVTLVCLSFQCGNGDSSGFDGGVDASGADVAPSFTLRVSPLQDSETVTIGLPSKTVQFQAFEKAAGATTETDVTAQATWATGDALIASSTGGGVIQLLGVGGVTTVTATLAGVNASATRSR